MKEADAGEEAVLYLHWGERMLDVQERMQLAELASAADMLRLCMAAVGGVIVVTGILAAGDWELSVPVLASFGVGVLALLAATFLLGAILARPSHVGGLAYGPNMKRFLALVMTDDSTNPKMVFSLAGTLPGLLEHNERVIGALQQRKARALNMLIIAALAILGALLYMLGGAILA